jgi:hypothetical protein
MVLDQQKAACVWRMVESKSVNVMQRKFRTMYGAPPSHKSILRWMEQLKATGSVKKQTSPGRPLTSPHGAETTWQAFVRSLRKSVRRASRELDIPRSMEHGVSHRGFKSCAYKLQVTQQLVKCVHQNQFIPVHTFAIDITSFISTTSMPFFN